MEETINNESTLPSQNKSVVNRIGDWFKENYSEPATSTPSSFARGAQITQREMLANEVMAKSFEAGIDDALISIYNGFGSDNMTPEELERLTVMRTNNAVLRDNIGQMYAEHRDDLTITPMLVGSIAASVFNPVDLAINIGIGAATAGSGVVLRMGAQAVGNLASETIRTQAVEGRNPTAKEYGIAAGVGLIGDALGNLATRNFDLETIAINNASDALDGVPIKTAFIQTQDAITGTPGATKQALQTQYGAKFEVDTMASRPELINPNTINSVDTPTYLSRRNATYNQTVLDTGIGKNYIEDMKPYNYIDKAFEQSTGEFKLYAESVDPKGLGRPIKFDNFEGSLKKDYLNYDVQRQYISNEYS
ncbi:MAG: hypothetical protein ACRC6A_06180, partial [Fusobacteriaceae bacterium]